MDCFCLDVIVKVILIMAVVLMVVVVVVVNFVVVVVVVVVVPGLHLPSETQTEATCLYPTCLNEYK